MAFDPAINNIVPDFNKAFVIPPQKNSKLDGKLELLKQKRDERKERLNTFPEEDNLDTPKHFRIKEKLNFSPLAFVHKMNVPY